MSTRRIDQLPRTKWFSGHVKPVRPGVYEREFPAFVLFAEWTGHEWLCGSFMIARARRIRVVSSLQPGRDCVRWRGITGPT